MTSNHLLVRTDQFLFLAGMLIGQLILLKTAGAFIYQVLFKDPFLHPHSVFRLLSTRGKPARLLLACQSFKLLGGYVIIIFIFTLSGSAIAGYVATELAGISVTDGLRQLYVSFSFLVGTMIASSIRVLPSPLSETMIDNVFCQAVLTVGSVLVFWGCRFELTPVEIFRPFFGTLRELAKHGFVVPAIGFLFLAMLLTETAVFAGSRDLHKPNS